MEKNRLILVLFMIVFVTNGCAEYSSDKSKNIELKDEAIVDKEISDTAKTDTISKIQHEEDISNCVFDQLDQTDEFLKGLEELKGYTWNAETKTAEITLNDHWQLTIRRGGCDHFDMHAFFIYDRILSIEKDKGIIFDKVIWITSLLEDFDGNKIKTSIEEGEFNITKEDEFNYYGNFMDTDLYELYYFNFNNKDRTTFKIGYYYN